MAKPIARLWDLALHAHRVDLSHPVSGAATKNRSSDSSALVFIVAQRFTRTGGVMNLHVYQPQTAVQSELGPLVFPSRVSGRTFGTKSRGSHRRSRISPAARAIVLLYAGVDDKSRVFTFKECIDEVQTYFAELLANEKRSISLVGHSWGGFLALTLIEKFAKPPESRGVDVAASRVCC